MADDRRVGDFGQTYSVDVTSAGVDPTTMDLVEIFARKPDSGVVVKWVPTSLTSTHVNYVFQAGDLSEPGVYRGDVKFTKTGVLQQTTVPFFISVGRAV